MPEAPFDYEHFLKELASPKFTSLLPIQLEVLHAYAKNFENKKDVAFEMPTGKGKSLVALLIAERLRRLGKRVAILSANKTLARQLHEREATSLGVPTVLLEGSGSDIPPHTKRAYDRKGAVAIMNYWVYFNQNPAIDPADVLIMDDAHLAEHSLSSLFTIEITRHEHGTLFSALISELAARFPEYTVVQEAVVSQGNVNCPSELLSFLDQHQFVRRFQEIVEASPYLVSDRDLKFRWERNKNSLNEANIYLSRDSIWIRPGVYPVESNTYYSGLTQCVFLSATIGHLDDLARQLGTRKMEKVPVSAEHMESTCGRRLVLMNWGDDAEMPESLAASILAGLAISPKSLWLCSSAAEARKRRDTVMEWLNSSSFVGHPSWVLTNLGNEIDQFRQSPTGHLFVGGRFDGMNFEQGECRIVVLTTIPRAINPQEDFFCAYLRDAGFMNRRLNGRIVQALGRCNRATEDYAVYFLIDKRFETHLSRDSNRTGLPKSLGAELDIAMDLATEPNEDQATLVSTFLSGSFTTYDARFRTAASIILPAEPTSNITIPVHREILAWNALFSSHNYSVAQSSFTDCWEAAKSGNLLELGGYYGWCSAKAEYLGAMLEGSSIESSLGNLKVALERGGRSAWFNRMRASLARAAANQIPQNIIPDEYHNCIIRAFDERLEREGTRGTKFEKWRIQLVAKIESTRHNEFCSGLQELGMLVGYAATRPKHNSATDNLWRGAFGGVREALTYEVKVEHEGTTKISSTDVGQAHTQLSRANSEFSHLGYVISSFIITHLDDIESDAASALGLIRIIRKDGIIELCRLILDLLTTYRNSWDADRLEARLAAAAELRPKLPQEGWLSRLARHDSHTIPETVFLAEWSSGH